MEIHLLNLYHDNGHGPRYFVLNACEYKTLRIVKHFPGLGITPRTNTHVYYV